MQVCAGKKRKSWWELHSGYYKDGKVRRMSIESLGTFFPHLNSQYGKYSDIDTHYLVNYNAEKVEEKGFTVEDYKKTSGMSLPRLYLVVKAKVQTSKYPRLSL